MSFKWPLVSKSGVKQYRTTTTTTTLLVLLLLLPYYRCINIKIDNNIVCSQIYKVFPLDWICFILTHLEAMLILYASQPLEPLGIMSILRGIWWMCLYYRWYHIEGTRGILYSVRYSGHNCTNWQQAVYRRCTQITTRWPSVCHW